MKKSYSLRLLSLLAAWMLWLPVAHGIGITLTLQPSSVSVVGGEVVVVDVVIAGLGRPPAVGAFDLDVGFNDAVLEPLVVNFGTFLGDPLNFQALTAFSFATPGIVDFAEVSLLSPDELNDLQPATFTLAALAFRAIATGMSDFGFVGEVRVDDAFGIKLVIPEPATILLVALGLCAVAAGRSRSRRAT